MSTLDVRNLIPTKVGIQTDDGSVAISTSTTVVGTPTPTIQNPFAVGYVATSTSVDLPNGTSLNLPNLTQDDLQQVNSIFGGMSTQNLDNVHKASQRLAKALFAAVAQNSSTSTMVTSAGAFGIGGATFGSSAGGASGGQTVAAAGGAGSGSAQNGSAGSDNSASADINSTVDNLTSSFYQTMAQGGTLNVQPDDDDSDDDDDDDGDNWGTGGSVPQMQTLGSTAQLPITDSSLPITNTAGATTTAGAAASAGAGATAAAGATGSSAAVNQNLIVQNPTLNLNTLTTQNLETAASTSTGGISSTQNKLLSPSSPNQAPVVSAGTPEVYSAAANAVQAYQQGSSDAALIETGNTSTGSLDYDGAVNAVTYMGIIGLQNQLGQYAKQTQDQLNELNQARTEYQDVNSAVAAWPAGQQTQYFTWTYYDANGHAATSSGSLTYAQATALKENLADQVNSMSSTNQEQQLNLQNLTQSYSEAINTMSNLLKMNFDTVKAVINNIRS